MSPKTDAIGLLTVKVAEARAEAFRWETKLSHYSSDTEFSATGKTLGELYNEAKAELDRWLAAREFVERALDVDQPLKFVTRDAVFGALVRAGGNRAAAARSLGLCRSRFYRLARSHGLIAGPAPEVEKGVQRNSTISAM
jgi:DNA-binding NtrC family response regulator